MPDHATGKVVFQGQRYLATGLAQGIKLPVPTQVTERPLEQPHIDTAAGRVVIAGRKRLAHAAYGKIDARRDLVTLRLQDLRIAAPGQKLRVGINVADQIEYFPGSIGHQRGAIDGFQVEFACKKYALNQPRMPMACRKTIITATGVI